MKMLCAILLCAPCSVLVAFAQPSSAPLNLDRTITLPGIEGKFDHLTYDKDGHRLFAAATGSKAVVVVDLANDKIAQTITGLGKPHGLAWIDRRLFIADGGKGELDVLEGVPLKLVRSIRLSEDADDMAYDPATNLLYVGHGGTDTANPPAVAVIDTKVLAKVVDLPMSAHPEALELDPVHDRIFVNVSDTGEVVVIDGKTHTISTRWPLTGENGNTPLAFDAARNLLLVGCRQPAKLLVLNAETGKELASASSDTGVDDLFYQPESHMAYLIAGSGDVDTYTLLESGKLQRLSTTKTLEGAKTGLLVEERRTLFVGIPGTSAPSTIRAYRTPAN